MRVLMSLLVALIISLPAFADKLIIPFDCYPKQLQAAFATQGLKLDLSGVDRTDDSWGFLENQGTRFILYTYNPVQDWELKLLLETIMQIEAKRNNEVMIFPAPDPEKFGTLTEDRNGEK